MSKQTTWRHYAIALVIFLIALLLRLLLAPVESGYAFLCFYPAMVVTFYLCGIGPGVFFTVFSAVAAYFIFIPLFRQFAGNLSGEMATVMFLVSATLIGWIIGQLRQQAEHAHAALSTLRQSEQRYLGLLEDQTELICRFKADGTVLYVNEAYCRFFGKPYASIVGHTWHPVAWEEDLPLINERLRTLSPDHPVVTIENRIVTSVGDIRWGQFVNRAFFDGEGRLLEVQAVGRDITDRKAMEEQLATSAKEIEDLYEHAPCGYHSLGPDGTYLRINATELQWLGCRREDVVGRLKPSDFFTPAGQDTFRQQLRFFLERGSLENLEFDLLGRDGTSRHVSLSATAIRDASGNILMSRSVLHDITDRKRVEAALKQLNSTLELRIREETEKNRQKDHLLIQQSRLAAMGEMVGNIAHQWRQPLNALVLVLANIEDAARCDELTPEYLEELVGNGENLIHKMSTTIDDFRHFFRPQKQPAPFSAATAIKQALSLVEASLANQQIALRLEMVEDIQILGYANEFSQVVLNLVGNAKDAIMAQRKLDGVVGIRLARDESHAIVVVADNGGGIPAPIMAKIFEPYFSTKELGTGIGLYMSKMIIENSMGGSIIAHNMDAGAEFTLICPLYHE